MSQEPGERGTDRSVRWVHHLPSPGVRRPGEPVAHLDLTSLTGSLGSPSGSHGWRREGHWSGSIRKGMS
ncbi:hypothetical protein E2C01_027350 [Portunus trituberculatus]|uniref:Uncharacterized protein n=1 Tax=Portunus trituberculatus TaxID=210409 RepID=A0A5B7EHN6_PORTR|nr:hypothetical protein [Portunus trituberculatus]